jgi:hypothetical protein
MTEAQLGLEYHDNLNPLLWNEKDELNPDVRNKLLAFGRAFQSFGHIPDQAVKDIWMVGGNCGYNYTPFSDIDVHVIIEKGLLGGGVIIDEYLKSLKLLWSAKHNVSVRGYSLEPYFQAVGEAIQSVGIFSLLNNTWVQKPSKGSYDFDNNKELHARVDHYQSLIDHLIDTGSGVDKFEDLKKKLSALRKDGLAQGGEFSLGNLTFKSLRNSGHLDKMTKYMLDSVDKQLSL